MNCIMYSEWLKDADLDVTTKEVYGALLCYILEVPV